MKLKEIYDELNQIAKDLGISVRKESGNFKSGYCTIKNNKVIILNKTNPLETASSILALSLGKNTVDKLYIKPAVREFIEKETLASETNNKEFSLEVK